MNTRAVAASVLFLVVSKGRSLTDALNENTSSIDNPKDKALVQELCFGVMRWWWTYDFFIKQLMSKPLKGKDDDIRSLIMLGMYQLQEMRIPDHAAVSETVDACKVLNKQWASKLVNGVLRNFQRQSDQLSDKAQSRDHISYSHPQWMLESIKSHWSDHWQSILSTNNTRPPMVLRVNLSQTSRVDYMAQLEQQGIKAEPFEYNDSGIVLDSPVAVDALPSFSAGQVSVQDGSAQLAKDCLFLEKGFRVLDVCAAPGGKTAHILESNAELEALVAVDIDAGRLQRVEENLERLKLEASLVQGDATRPDTWWDGQLFQRILLDAPCSATGVIRRHPDIKLLRRATDIDQLVKIQAEILASVWPLLAPEGMLLYATCSVFPEENEQQIRAFAASQNDVQVVPLQGQWGMPCEFGRQILTGQNNMDGFYYACLQKVA